MTPLLRRLSSSRGWRPSFQQGGQLAPGVRVAAVCLLASLSGCLPAKTPADAPLTGEPSEVEILRADNAELSRRVHELRAEKAELKRQVSLLELKVTSVEPEEAAAEPVASAAPAEPPAGEAEFATPDGEPARAPAAVVVASSAAPRAAPRSALPEAPVLISGSAEATDFDLGRQALEAGAYQSADQTLTRFLTHNPRHPFADDALVLRGRARAARRQFDAAERDFRLVADRYPEELVAPEAWLELVRLCQTRGDDPGARQASRALLDRYPDSAAASLVPSEFLE